MVTFVKTIYRVLYTLKQHLFSGAFEFFDSISMCLIIQELILWIQIIIDSNYIINEDGSDGVTRLSMNKTCKNLSLYTSN